MINHVKLEIAIQIASENIANLYNKKRQAQTEEELLKINQELEQAYYEKERVSLGDAEVVEHILKQSARGKNGK